VTDEVREIAAAGLREISDAFSEETGRRPSARELAEIFEWSFPEAQIRFETSGPDESASLVAELNDAAFVAAANLVGELERSTGLEFEKSADAERILEIVVEALRRCGDDVLSSVPRSAIRGVAVMAKGPSPKPGDIVAIPASGEKHHLAVVLENDRFGVAYGLFKGATDSTSVSKKSHPPVNRRPVYSGEEPIASGRWEIVGHDEALRDLFDDAEIFHKPDPDDDELGQYGAAEKADESLRKLTKKEADEVGLLDGGYRQILSPEQVEKLVKSEA
jgi:hypothetical protein